MNFSEEHIELFRNYLSGGLSNEDSISLEKRFSEEKQFKKEFESFKQFEQALIDAETLEIFDEVGSWEQKYQKADKKPASIPQLWLVVAGVAAVLAISWIIWNPSAKLSDEELVASYYEPYDNVLTVRGKKEVLDQALLEYDRENYESALKLFSQYPDDPTGTFYCAESLMAIEKYGQAVDIYNEVVKTNGVFKEVALYHRALALLGDGRRKEAIKQLKAIPKSNAYFEKTRDLLNRM